VLDFIIILVFPKKGGLLVGVNSPADQ